MLFCFSDEDSGCSVMVDESTVEYEKSAINGHFVVMEDEGLLADPQNSALTIAPQVSPP